MRRLDGLAATLLVVMWSSGFIGAELGTRFAPADTLLGWRYVAAALIVGTWAALRGDPARPADLAPARAGRRCCASASTSAAW